MKRTELLMGTRFEIEVFDRAVPEGALEGAFRWLRDVEAVFSTFRTDSEISRLARGDLHTDDSSTEVRHVLSRCRELSDATGNRFAPERTGAEGRWIDPTGFVKGWSVDEAATILQVAGLDNFMIDAGGDIRCVGSPGGAPGWRIGIRDPAAPEETALIVGLAEGAVATSGAYFRGDHIWGGGGPESGVSSVTVVGPELGTADALATAIFGDGADDLSWMSTFPDYGVLVIGRSGTITWTASGRTVFRPDRGAPDAGRP